MKHEVIERPRPQARRLWNWTGRTRAADPHSMAATRFAEICAAIGGTTMLHDLMPDVVTVSFGDRTRGIWQRLRSRGWSFVGMGDWTGERVLGVSFNGDRRADRTVEELADALIAIVGELEMAETRAW